MRVNALYRHPVKSMQGEQVEQTMIMPYGFYGDRSHTFKREDGRYLTITQLPQMAVFQASFQGEESFHKYPPVQVVSPSGKSYSYEEERLREELEQLWGGPLTKEVYQPGNVPLGAIEEEAVLLITDSSLSELEKRIGKPAVSGRFRPNIILEAGLPPFSESDLIGMRLQTADGAVLEGVRMCPRCSIINVDPESGESDSDYLRATARELKNEFGLYLRVIRPGKIHRNERLQLVSS
ncbi:MOSC domain-containing protein [Bacillus daqingensis]|uniref:MOSC domain-containing protein n=1 Tax=Bacillus daqingensis TaxID=872396 RepID=A0ABV9NZC2_9BACI